MWCAVIILWAAATDEDIQNADFIRCFFNWCWMWQLCEWQGYSTSETKWLVMAQNFCWPVACDPALHKHLACYWLSVSKIRKVCSFFGKVAYVSQSFFFDRTERTPRAPVPAFLLVPIWALIGLVSGSMLILHLLSMRWVHWSANGYCGVWLLL